MRAALLFVLWMMSYNWLYDFVKTAYLGKFCFSSYGPKHSPPTRLQGTLVKSCKICWVWSGMSGHTQQSPKLLSNNTTGKDWVYLFVACTYTYMDIMSFQMGMVRHAQSLWNNKSPISLKRIEWFCYFLHVVRDSIQHNAT